MCRSVEGEPPRWQNNGEPAWSQPASVPLRGGGGTRWRFPPGVKPDNWVQTMPGRDVNVSLRLYSPLESSFTGTRRPGEIELVR